MLDTKATVSDLRRDLWGPVPDGVLRAPLRSARYEVTIALGEKGWTPYRVRFDPEGSVWLASVIDRGRAA